MQDVYYCPVWQVGWDAHGKEYPVKTHRGWRYININNNKLGVSKLIERIRIRNFDDFIFCYIFENWHSLYPCPAMAFYVNKKIKKTQ